MRKITMMKRLIKKDEGTAADDDDEETADAKDVDDDEAG